MASLNVARYFLKRLSPSPRLLMPREARKPRRSQIALVLLNVSLALQPVALLGQACEAPPPASTPAVVACNPATDGTLINALPYSITSSGSYCLNFSPPSSNTGSIAITASNVTLKGQNRTIYGSLTITNSNNASVSDIRSNVSLVLGTGNTNISVTRSSFRGTSEGNALNAAVSISGLSITHSRFVCSCSQTSAESTCAHIDPGYDSPGNILTDLVFDHNVVEGDCVKNFRIQGGAYAGAPVVRQTITNNWLHALGNRTKYDGANEPVNMTWRASTGGTDSASRIKFANNSLLADHNMVCLYLRDDLANVDFEDNCCEVKNPGKLWVWYGAIMTGGGKVLPHLEPSGLRFIGNRVIAPNDPAFWFETYTEASPSQNNRTVFRENIIASGGSGGAVHIGRTETGALWEHNTILSTLPGERAFTTDNATSIRPSEFYSNIFSCNASGGCLMLNDLQTANYTGSNNLFYNSDAGRAAVYLGGALTLSSWQSGGGRSEDSGSVFGNPLFVNPAAYDFHLGDGSPARGLGIGGTDAGATFGQSDTLAPAAPQDLGLQ